MKFKLIAITFLLILLTGCVSYKAVGKFENYNEVFVGNVNANLMTGGGKFDITAVNSNINCNGIASPPDKMPLSGLLDCSGQEGNGSGSCSDGRSLTMRWYANSCTRGYGKGATPDGIAFQFAFGLTQEEAMTTLDKLADEAKGKAAYPSGQSQNIEQPQNKSEDDSNKIRDAEDKCKKLGMKNKTEKFNKCVLENSR
jgi:hypothetical protein